MLMAARDWAPWRYLGCCGRDESHGTVQRYICPWISLECWGHGMTETMDGREGKRTIERSSKLIIDTEAGIDATVKTRVLLRTRTDSNVGRAAWCRGFDSRAEPLKRHVMYEHDTI